MEKQLQKRKLGPAPQQANDASPSILLGHCESLVNPSLYELQKERAVV